MTHRTKSILKRSINEFLSVSDEYKDEMVLHVQNQLKDHENALKHIGMGLDEDMVQGARIFLRIFKYK